MVEETSTPTAPITTPETTTPTAPQEPSLIERAEKVRDEMLASEKRTFEKIAQFEKELAEKVLSGRAEIFPTKSQDDQDKEEAAKTVENYLG